MIIFIKHIITVCRTMNSDLIKKVEELQKTITEEREEHKDIFIRLNKTSKEIIDSLVEENRQLKNDVNDLKYYIQELQKE
jgi:hypothetical protein